MIQSERVQPLNRHPVKKGKYVLYWMQASQRAEYNHALEFAIRQANLMKEPLVVFFGLTDSYPEANERHYHFMIEGLRTVQESLRARGIVLLIERVSPEIGAAKMAREASLVVCDRGYLRLQKKWRTHVAENIDCLLLQVESDVVVPVDTASQREEFSAATLRRWLLPLLQHYLVDLEHETPRMDSSRLDFPSVDLSRAGNLAETLPIDHSVRPVAGFRGGTDEAKRRLEEFLNSKLDNYAEMRNDPTENALSDLSPYLHFGQISPLYVALRVSRVGSPGVMPFLEELVVRRELAINFVHHNEHYDSFSGLPAWARRTLIQHQKDTREYIYSIEDLESASTHDPIWNAAQLQMMRTGKMHGYMRMYWGKKILEWSASPEEAFKIALYLNNRYELDGRDPNSFAGIAWCFGKHDRPWASRPVFGNIRYMSSAGLKRKFDVTRYIARFPSESPQ